MIAANDSACDGKNVLRNHHDLQIRVQLNIIYCRPVFNTEIRYLSLK